MKILESLKHLAWHCIFTCNNKLKWYIILLLWIPYFLILGMFCFYAFYLLVPLSAFIFTGGFLGKIPPIDGKAALDQTSVVGIIRVIFNFLAVIVFSSIANNIKNGMDLPKGCRVDLRGIFHVFFNCTIYSSNLYNFSFDLDYSLADRFYNT